MKNFIYLFLSLIALNNLNAASRITTVYAVNTIMEDGTPLCVAISKGDFEMVKKLVDYGAKINEKSRDLTPLMVAVIYNHIEIIKYLIAKGADLEIKNEEGNTALKIARTKHLDEVKLLLENELKKY